MKLVATKWQWFFIMLLAVLATLGIPAAMRLAQRRNPQLPYRDSFDRNKASEWISYGGAWHVARGAVVNRSDERGAKLITGSPNWTNYQMTTELKMIGHAGDVGVLVRVNDAARGIDSYNGYYVGLRPSDSALIVGRADYGWLEARPVAIRGGVRSGVWYRLRVVAYGCNIGAEATSLDNGQSSWAAFHEEPCVTHGKIGVRSMVTGGAWRNISVVPATRQDWLNIRAHAGSLLAPIYPVREDDYDRMRDAYFASTGVVPRGGLLTTSEPASNKSGADLSQAKVVSIASVRTMTSTDNPIAVRGVVTLISPLYIEDSTGGIAVRVIRPAAFNLGDEVEVIGKPRMDEFTPWMEADNVRLLWDRTLMVPASVTSTQAASGAFDSSLVELRGILRSKHRSSDGVITLDLTDAAQNFQAIVHGDLSTRAYRELTPGSRLRITGVCRVTPVRHDNGTAFTIMLRSMEDVEVLAGPPLWTGRTIAELVLLCLGLIVAGAWFYLRMERAKMRAILHERERLAHDMHDTLAQSFAGVGFHLQGMRNSMRNGGADAAAMLGKLDTACDLVAHTHREASATIAALHPDADENRDLLVALENYTHSILEGDGLPLRLVREGAARPMSLPVRDLLFQVGREAIANTLRHSMATKCELVLAYRSKTIQLTVRDNGIGFDALPSTAGFGIKTMEHRCEEARAKMTIESALGKGTSVFVEAPYGSRGTLLQWLKSRMSGALRFVFGYATRYRVAPEPAVRDRFVRERMDGS